MILAASEERMMKKACGVFLVSLLLTACNSLSVDNYDRLKVGMTYEQVSDVIGKTKSCNEQLGTRTCVWGDEARQIKVVFIANRATLFSHKGLN
jgi:hypothetical protein